jgi:cytidine deaminase
MSLLDEARRIRERAHAPYSGFKVGAAIRAKSGRIYTGVNVENASYPETGAIAAMVAGGDTEIAEVAVIADCPDPVPPCGGCRQRIAEFASGDVPVTMGTVAGATLTRRLDELLPGAFVSAHMAG